ncbi:MAG TPA: hypothetical protein VGI33_06200 [Paenibacillus sp.]|jgi:hypothetical protein
MSVDYIGTVKGNWDVSLPLSKEKSEAMTKTFHPEFKLVFKDKEYMVEKLVLGPVITQLVLKGDFSFPEDDIHAVIEDDIGTLLGWQGGGGGPKGIKTNFSPLSELNPRPKYFTLIMREAIQMTDELDGIQDRKPFSSTYPLVLKGDQGGTMTVTNVEFQEKQTVVYYKASQSSSQRTFFMFENNKGERIATNQNPVRISKDSLSFKLVFPEMNERDIAGIVTQPFSYPKDQEMLRVQIPLNWE